MSREDLDKVQTDPRVQSLMKIIADATSVHSAATALIQNEPWDLMCVYYDAIDHFGHAFMRYHPPQRERVDDWDFKVFNYCIEAGYTRQWVSALVPLIITDPNINANNPTAALLDVRAWNVSATNQRVEFLNLYYDDVTPGAFPTGVSASGSPFSAIPEPDLAGICLLALGAGGLLERRRRKAA